MSHEHVDMTDCAGCGHPKSEHYVKRRDGTGPMHCGHADIVTIADGPDYDNDWCRCVNYTPRG